MDKCETTFKPGDLVRFNTSFDKMGEKPAINDGDIGMILRKSGALCLTDCWVILIGDHEDCLHIKHFDRFSGDDSNGS